MMTITIMTVFLCPLFAHSLVSFVVNIISHHFDAMSPSLTVLSVVRAILKDPKDQTEVWLLFANQTEDDILLRSELEEIANDPVNGKRFHLWYTLDRPPEGWKYSSGFINKDMCAAHLPPPADDTMLFVCGPPPSECLSCHFISFHIMSCHTMKR
jgi:Oxidoreductase NAD-binding domain